MVRIAITQRPMTLSSATLPLGSVGYEGEANERGERRVWLELNLVKPSQRRARAGGEL